MIVPGGNGRNAMLDQPVAQEAMPSRTDMLMALGQWHKEGRLQVAGDVVQGPWGRKPLSPDVLGQQMEGGMQPGPGAAKGKAKEEDIEDWLLGLAKRAGPRTEQEKYESAVERQKGEQAMKSLEKKIMKYEPEDKE